VSARYLGIQSIHARKPPQERWQYLAGESLRARSFSDPGLLDCNRSNAGDKLSLRHITIADNGAAATGVDHIEALPHVLSNLRLKGYLKNLPRTFTGYFVENRYRGGQYLGLRVERRYLFSRVYPLPFAMQFLGLATQGYTQLLVRGQTQLPVISPPVTTTAASVAHSRNHSASCSKSRRSTLADSVPTPARLY
jgi:hypothetical protein